MTQQHKTLSDEQAAATGAEEINRYIGLEIAKLDCWHKWEDPTYPHCKQCMTFFVGDNDNPDYTSSLDLVAPIERIVIEKVGDLRYLAYLDDLIASPDYASVVTATAAQRARACMEAWKSQEGE